MIITTQTALYIKLIYESHYRSRDYLSDDRVYYKLYTVDISKYLCVFQQRCAPRLSRNTQNTFGNKNMLLPVHIKICFQPARAYVTLLRDKRDATVFCNIRTRIFDASISPSSRICKTVVHKSIAFADNDIIACY